MNYQRGRASSCPHSELAVGWALHALEPAEDLLIAAHLAGCPTCASIAADTEEVGAALGFSVPQMIPSLELERRILSVTDTGVTDTGRPEPIMALAPSTQPARQVTEPSEADFPGWLSITWADVVGYAGLEQALAVGSSRIG